MGNGEAGGANCAGYDACMQRHNTLATVKAFGFVEVNNNEYAL